jgi:predicted HD phosphohydrolase
VTLDGHTFGSQFEADCFKVLKKFNPELHVLYSKYLPTTRRWVCDFKIGDYWIEVSNFKQNYKNYFSNIEEKSAVVEANGGMFFFVQSLKELEEIASLM